MSGQGSIPGRGKIFSVPYSVQIGPGAQSVYQWVPGSNFHEDKSAGA
jgi:hypothetical protein